VSLGIKGGKFQMLRRIWTAQKEGIEIIKKREIFIIRNVILKKPKRRHKRNK
jgi:hypothetical protein